MFGRLEVFKYKIILRSHPGPATRPSFLPSFPPAGARDQSDISSLPQVCLWSDDGGAEAFEAPLDAGAGRSIDAVHRLELLGAQFVVSHAVLPVEGLCRCAVKGGSEDSQSQKREQTVSDFELNLSLYFFARDLFQISRMKMLMRRYSLIIKRHQIYMIQLNFIFFPPSDVGVM